MKIVNIQLLRGVAAIMVMLDHGLGVIAERTGSNYLPAMHGAAGVHLFFVISGFVMAHTTLRRRRPPGAFLRDRVLRVAPAYWAATLTVFAAAWLFPQAVKSTEARVEPLLKSLLFIPYAKTPGVIRPVLFVGWTLNYEMFFYLLFGLSLLLPGAGAFALTLAVLAVLAGAGLLLQPASPLLAFYTDPILLEFGLGMLIALAWDRLPVRPSGPVRVVLTIAAVLLVTALAAFPPVPYGPPVIVALTTALVMIALVLEGGELPGTGPLKAAGELSYSLYLWHTPVIYGVLLFAPWLPGGLPGWLLELAGMTGLSFLAAWLSHRLIERPALAWARSRTRSAPPPTPTPWARA